MQKSWKKSWIMHWRRIIIKNWFIKRRRTKRLIWNNTQTKQSWNQQLWRDLTVWIFSDQEKNTMKRWILPMTIVQQKLLKNLTSYVKLWNTKNVMLSELVRSKTCLFNNLRHYNIFLMKIRKIRERSLNHSSITERIETSNSGKKISRQFNLLTLR